MFRFLPSTIRHGESLLLTFNVALAQFLVDEFRGRGGG
jgi:hypothetical protein